MCDISEWGTPAANVSAKPTSRGRGRGFMKSFGEEDIATTTANLNLNGNGASDFSSDPWGSSADTGNYEQPRTNSRGCFKCGEDGHMSRDCPTGGGSRGRGCFKCGQEGHMSRECPTGGDGGGRSRACFKCGDETHQSRECPSGGGGGARSSACFKCGEEGHQSRECPSGGGGGARSSACFKCGEEGHQSRECPSGGGGGARSSACFKCGEEGHQSRECPNPGTGGRGGGGGGGSRACYKCGNEGHMSRECPEAGGDGGDKPRGCFNCGQEGHVSKECSEPPKAGPDGKPREVYIPVDISENADELFNSGISTGINFSRFQDLTAKVSGNNPPAQISRFEEAGLRDLILKNVLRAGYSTPTPIQKAAIPIVMAKRDLMACAQTGSGKTAAFLLPIIHNLLADGVSKESGAVQSPQAVIVAPTRELAIQIRSEANKFAYGSVLGVCIAYGGAQRRAQQEQITRGCNILVATTGRLKDYMDNGFINFSNLKFFVLDEADRMLDMGFMPDIKAFVDHPTMPIKKLRQTLLFSATFADEIQHLAAEFLNEYLFVSVGVIGCASSDVRQAFECVSQYAKKEKLVSCLTDIGNQRTLVFVESKVTADFIAAYLAETGFPTTSIHGDRLQSQREEALRDFKSGKRTILVATAVAARGLDIKGVEHVINYDLPQSIDEYVHRIGRTGRVGNTGNAMSFYDPDKDSGLAAPLIQILAGAQQDVPDFIQTAAESGFSSGGRSFSRDVRRPRGGGRGGRGREDVGGDSGWGGNRGASAAPLSTVEAEESWD